jgi:ABC-type uncharacterized transport system involved in gliding motility auxiliary subunit
VEGLTVTELMRTSIDGWGETNLQSLDQVGTDDADVQGPVSLAAAVSGGSEAPDPGLEVEDEASVSTADETALDDLRMVVVGDSDFATNSQLQNMPNATLLSNILNWLVEREVLVGIPPKQPEQVRLSLSQSELRRIAGLVLAGLPALALALGVFIYFRRRR